MSKNIIIQEGSESRQFTASKLKTALVGGGSCLWIPEDETRLGTKSITEDGTYEASGDGLYGYSSVTVRGIGKVTGKDPVTGEETQITAETNPQTGEKEIKTKVIPSSIRITTPPTRLIYNDGDLIDFAGMVVKAYTKSGALFTDETYPNGIIPDAELDKPVKTAQKQSAQTIQNSLFKLEPGMNVFFRSALSEYSESGLVVKQRNDSNDTAYVCVVQLSNGNFCGCTFSDGQYKVIYDWYHGDTKTGENHIYTSYNERYNMYMMYDSGRQSNDRSKWSSEFPTYTEAELEALAANNRQTIPVNWICPYGDQKTLTAAFVITVNPAPPPNSNAEPETDPEGGETP